jgi:transposase-like protein
LWITQHFTIRQLADLSGHSISKIRRIIEYWLEKPTPEIAQFHGVRYLVLDATYFHKDGCLMSLMNACDQTILSTLYVPRESFQWALPWLSKLKERALNPHAFTTDGERNIIRAIRQTWPAVTIQRCLYHIQHEGCRWLRSYPATEAGKALRRLLLTLPQIRSVKERNAFIGHYKGWLDKHRDFVVSLSNSIKANYDLKRTISMLTNAIPNMFHYLMDPHIHTTTNALEGWHSRIKRAYRQHAGLSQRHKIQFLKWFSHYENQQKTNNF